MSGVILLFVLSLHIVVLSVPGLLLALGTVDAFLLHYAFNSVIGQGPSVQLVFGLEVQLNLFDRSPV